MSWYVFTVSFKKEIEIKKELSEKGFEAYIPMRYRLRTLNGKRVRLFEPSIYGLVFVKGIKNDLLNFRNNSKLKNYMFLKSLRFTDGSLQYVIVRDAEMRNFQKLNDIQDAELTYYKPEELHITKGSKVKIMDGPFEGIVGIVQKIPGRHGQYLIVSLPNVAIAAVSIKPKFVKPLTKTIEKSKDVLKDSHKLALMATSLLTTKEMADRVEIIDKIKQLQKSLKDCKTFLPNDKANWLLAFYVSCMALEEPYSEYRDNLKKVMPKLKSNNLLLPFSHLLFYYETKDKKELQAADAITSKWDDTKYTEPQRRVLNLRLQLVSGSKDDANNK